MNRDIRTFRVDTRRILGPRSPLIFGQFIEHFHRQIYGGIFSPGSSLADEHGFRKDVLAALRRIGVPVLRWPGGCFASAYHWRDGVGSGRSPVWDPAWRVVEPNGFGTDEFIRLCTTLGAEPYICGNAGTGSPQELAEWVEYCNRPAGTKISDLRARNGADEPYRVPYWSIGNENYGAWEVGAKSADEWARFTTETAKLIRRVDPGVKLIVAATGDLDWDGAMLRSAGKYIDFVGIHGYGAFATRSSSGAAQEPGYAEVVRGGRNQERKIRKALSLLDIFDLRDRVKIAFDEWNPRGWYHPSFLDPDPRVEEREHSELNTTYTMADAISHALFLNAVLRNCASVGMANYSPAVNTRGPVSASDEGIVLRPTYHVMDLYSNRMLPVVLDSAEDAPAGDAEGGEPGVDIVATADERSQEIAVSIVNPHMSSSASVEILLLDASPADDLSLEILDAENPYSCNTAEHPESVGVRRVTRASAEAAAGREATIGARDASVRTFDSTISVRVPARSVSVLRCRLRR